MPKFKAKATIRKIDKGLTRIRNAVRSIQLDKSYVKAGLLSGKGGKMHKPRTVRIENRDHADFIKAQVAINPVLLGVLAHKAEKVRERKTKQPTNVQLGIIHEFGRGHMPARPFIRPAFARHREDYLALLRMLVASSVYSGKMPFDKALRLIGVRMAADMKKYVTAGPPIPPPNSPAWAAEKARRGEWKLAQRRRRAAKKGLPVVEGPALPPRTLVDTGQMVNSIDYAIIHRTSGESMSDHLLK
jgi:hypothetical protein